MNKNKKELFLGIDIGGSSVKFGWGTPKKGLLNFRKIDLENKSKSALIRTIDMVLQTVESDIGLEVIQGIGVGTPGTLNKKTRKIEGVNPNLTEWVDFEPSKAFPVFLRPKILVDNDANLMALAESYKLPQSKNVLGITIGSGIGCGFIIRRQIYHGANGYAMELGHNIVNINGAVCNCGRKGCLEAYASVNGMLKLLKKIDTKFDSLKNLYDIIKKSEKSAPIRTIIKTAVDYLSVAISNLAVNLDVNVIVIGGGAVEIEEYPTQKLIDNIYMNLPEVMKQKTLIKKAEYGNKAGVMGAILLAKHGLISQKGMNIAHTYL